MKTKPMNNEQLKRYNLHLSRIRRKYRENYASVNRTITNVVNLLYHCGRPVANIEYFPWANVAVVEIIGDMDLRHSMVFYVREREFEARYYGGFARFESPREAAVWLRGF